jgi:adenylate kinase
MFRLVADDASVVLSAAQVARISRLLLEFIPATRCEVKIGPGVWIRVPNHMVEELTPDLRAAIEATIGSSVQVEELPD